MSAPNPVKFLVLGVREISAACGGDRLLLAGAFSFTAGWSLMWASALDIIPCVPMAFCIALMAIGLGLPGWRRLRARAPCNAPATISPAVLPGATGTDRKIYLP